MISDEEKNRDELISELKEERKKSAKVENPENSEANFSGGSSADQFRQLFDQAAVGILLTDRAYNLIEANKRALSVLGYAKNEVVGGNFYDFIHPQDIVYFYTLENTVKSLSVNNTLGAEKRIRAKGGEYISVLLSVGELKDDLSDPKVMIMFQNISRLKATQQNLKESEDRYRLIAENSVDVIWSVNSNHKVVYMTPSAQQMFGYAPEEVIGSDMLFAMHPDDVDVAKQAVARRYAWDRKGTSGDSPQCLELRQIRKNGEVFWTELLSIPLRDERGEIVGFQGTTRDISGRKHAEKELQRREETFRTLASKAPISIMHLDSQGQIVFVNDWHIQQFARNKLGKEFFLSRSLYELPGMVKAGICEQVAAVLEGECVEIEEVFFPEFTGGHSGWVNVRGVPIWENGKVTGGIVIREDLTEQKRTKDALQESKKEADRANRAKSDFLAKMSHEIRTPINGIIGMVQLLQSTVLNEEQEEYVEMAWSSTHRLNRLLSDLLDMSKIEADRLELCAEEFKMSEVMRSIRDISGHACRTYRNYLDVHWDQGIPEKLVGDQIRLTQVLFNLAGNACKYTQDGRVTVSASLVSGRNAEKCRILFTVEDTGKGVPEDMIDRMFETYTRVGEFENSFARQLEGVGLGLPLVKRVVELMGGNMSLSTCEGEGSSFYVSLPFCIPESSRDKHQEGKDKASVAGLQKIHLLLVDDDEATQIFIKRLLEKRGIDVTVASNGEKALSQLHENDYDCVLMDAEMPVLDGVETTKRIRSSDAAYRDVPIIALSAYAMKGHREEFLQAGMDDYLAKPIEGEKLLEAINRSIDATHR